VLPGEASGTYLVVVRRRAGTEEVVPGDRFRKRAGTASIHPPVVLGDLLSFHSPLFVNRLEGLTSGRALRARAFGIYGYHRVTGTVGFGSVFDSVPQRQHSICLPRIYREMTPNLHQRRHHDDDVIAVT
jgi:hypothetical protein